MRFVRRRVDSPFACRVQHLRPLRKALPSLSLLSSKELNQPFNPSVHHVDVNEGHRYRY